MADPTRCAHPGCPQEIPSHKWGHVKAVGWFFQKDDTAWCPDHIPAWVAQWRLDRARRAKG